MIPKKPIDKITSIESARKVDPPPTPTSPARSCRRRNGAHKFVRCSAVAMVKRGFSVRTAARFHNVSEDLVTREMCRFVPEVAELRSFYMGEAA